MQWTIIEADGRSRAFDRSRRAFASDVERTVPFWTVLAALAATVFACGALVG